MIFTDMESTEYEFAHTPLWFTHRVLCRQRLTPQFCKRPNSSLLQTTHLCVAARHCLSWRHGIRARWNGAVFTSRSGKTIVAPTWFTQGFPQQVLDGELWLARNSFEQTASIVLRDTPNLEWQNIKFMLFDLPEHKGTFSQRLTELRHAIDAANNPYLQLIPQFKVSSHSELMLKLDEALANGAEGLMLHHQDAYYQDGRSTSLLKLKKYQDAEAKVIAHIIGKGKYKSMMGSLLVELDNGLQFKIGSGFSDLQRPK